MSRRSMPIGTRSRDISLFEVVRGNPATFGLIIVMVILFAVDLLLCFLISPCISLKVLFGQINQRVWEGEVWRLVTAMFVHGDIIHLGSNVLFLLIFGMRLEELMGSRWVLLVFLVSGFMGNVLSLFIMRPEILSLGASGGVFGLLGALLVLLARLYPAQARAMVFLAIIFFIITISVNTNIFAHFGGFVTGALLMYGKLTTTRSKNRTLVRL